MTPSQTLAAAEVMRRAAEGQPVNKRMRGGTMWLSAGTDFSWDWHRYEYEIAEPPPHGPTAHNPDALTPLQVETHLGWRLLDRDEIIEASVPAEIQQWMGPDWCGKNYYGHSPRLTYRTKLTREELAAARGIKSPVPWSKPEHVPLNCWFRALGCDQARLGMAIDDRGVWIHSVSEDFNATLFRWEKLSEGFEYSTDRVTWRKCEVTP